MRGHVDAESLALCAEGLLSRRRSDRIRSHVASCSQCAATQARLTEVPALLAHVPPPSLPPGIAARLDAALSAEAARRAAHDPGIVPEPATPPQHPDSVPGPRPARPQTGRPQTGGPRGPRLRFPVPARVLAAAAGALVVAGGVGYAVSQSSSPSTSSSGSSSSGSVAAPASRAAASPGFRSPASDLTPGGPGTGTGLTVRHSGTQYQQGTLAAQAIRVEHTHSAGVNQPGKASGGLSRQAPGSALTECVDKVAGRDRVRAGDVKLIDEARYGGRRATVIVVRAASARTGTIYVAGPRCSASDSDILAQVALPAAG
jgi:hypothetical protein